jgi:hypothetical protein
MGLVVPFGKAIGLLQQGAVEHVVRRPNGQHRVVDQHDVVRMLGDRVDIV